MQIVLRVDGLLLVRCCVEPHDKQQQHEPRVTCTASFSVHDHVPCALWVPKHTEWLRDAPYLLSRVPNLVNADSMPKPSLNPAQTFVKLTAAPQSPWLPVI